jgi:acyl-coenzyme A synthetase/AMP-(fatty) acid ligase
MAHSRMRLIPYKVPREIRPVPQLPKNAAHKTDEKVLAKWAAKTAAVQTVSP